MKENFDKHIIEYAVLFMLAIVIGSMFYYFRYDKVALTFLAGASSFSYAAWGIVHHQLEGRLTKVIAAEYVIFGALIFFLLYTVLNFV